MNNEEKQLLNEIDEIRVRAGLDRLDEISRRNFLKRAAALGAGAAIGGIPSKANALSSVGIYSDSLSSELWYFLRDFKRFAYKYDVPDGKMLSHKDGMRDIFQWIKNERFRDDHDLKQKQDITEKINQLRSYVISIKRTLSDITQNRPDIPRKRTTPFGSLGDWDFGMSEKDELWTLMDKIKKMEGDITTIENMVERFYVSKRK